MVKVFVIGAINWDVNLFVKRFPRHGEEVVVSRILRVPGGKAGNVAVAAARLLGANEVAILGGLGDDDVAKEQVKIFQSEGIVISGLKFSSEAESGQAYIVVEEQGENVIHTHQGANATFTPHDLDDSGRQKLISEASVVTIMDPPLETSAKLAAQAKASGKTVVWDPGVMSELGIEKTRSVLQNVDYVVTNEGEILNFAGTQDYDVVAAAVRKINGRLSLIAKLGAKGCVLCGDVVQASKG
jgi:ribokinase